MDTDIWGPLPCREVRLIHQQEIFKCKSSVLIYRKWNLRTVSSGEARMNSCAIFQLFLQLDSLSLLTLGHHSPRLCPGVLSRSLLPLTLTYSEQSVVLSWHKSSQASLFWLRLPHPPPPYRKSYPCSIPIFPTHLPWRTANSHIIILCLFLHLSILQNLFLRIKCYYS